MMEWLEKIWTRIAAALAPATRQVRARVDPLYAQARARYDKLEPRERILVRVAGGLIALLLVYSLVYEPIVAIPESMQNRVQARERDLVEVRRLTAAYQQLSADLKAAEGSTVPQGKDFSLFSVVESTMTATIGRDKIGSITPAADRRISDGLTQYSVQLKLNNVSLGQVVDALYGIRTMRVPVAVANLRIQRRTQDTHSYDVDMTCVALGKNG
ncbi:MAG TPA: type II secretion system protein GspM [Candidatus Binataceae bacterium]|jgi:type II secretory pathway component PulM